MKYLGRVVVDVWEVAPSGGSGCLGGCGCLGVVGLLVLGILNYYWPSIQEWIDRAKNAAGEKFVASSPIFLVILILMAVMFVFYCIKTAVFKSDSYYSDEDMNKTWAFVIFAGIMSGVWYPITSAFLGGIIGIILCLVLGGVTSLITFYLSKLLYVVIGVLFYSIVWGFGKLFNRRGW